MKQVQMITPIVPFADLEAATTFLKSCLGFETRVLLDNYAYCERDGAGIRLVKAPDDADMDDPARQVSVYICAEDVDAYYEEHSAAIGELPESCRRAPFDQDYGQREFHLIHGPCLFFIGQPA